jgi:hypothetical protein
MGIFDRLFGRRNQTGASSSGRKYEYPTGNIEFGIRVNRGEPLAAVMEDIKPKWTPGNEHLWHDYDVESLIDTAEKQQYTVNQLLYSRITVYRALRAAGKDVRGSDPFEYVDQVPEVFGRLKGLFPDALNGTGGVSRTGSEGSSPDRPGGPRG